MRNAKNVLSKKTHDCKKRWGGSSTGKSIDVSNLHDETSIGL